MADQGNSLDIEIISADYSFSNFYCIQNADNDAEPDVVPGGSGNWDVCVTDDLRCHFSAPCSSRGAGCTGIRNDGGSSWSLL